MSEEKKEDFLKQSQQFWSEQYGKEISIEETKEINRNLAGFFEILMKWDSDKSQNESSKE